MKYIRTKDGRIVEESNLKSALKQTCITLIRKRNNETLRQIICDNFDDYEEMRVIGEYCKCHKINPKEIRYERTVLLNEILNQADTIEELCDWFIVEGDDNEITYHKTLFRAETDGKDYILESNETYTIYGCILVKGKGLIYIAKMNEEGALELL